MTTPRTTTGRRLSFLLFLLPATASLAFLSPSIYPLASATKHDSRDPTKPHTHGTNTALCSISDTENNPMAPPIPRWYQHEISITAPSRGCHLITSQVNNAIRNDLSTIKIGMANLFIQHTSASLTINENADPDVRRDMEVALNKIVPAQWTKDGTFRHTMEGEDDMPGHVKSSLMGPSLNIPIKNCRLALGTWQGIYLNEHRDQGGWGGGHTRNIVITLQGQS
eukprot:CCRYP_015870-RB/>CCRYP_015870-RB protein AED:0.26 eAED:0.26 QI:241/1/1/1/1/1/5/325/223